MSDLEAENTDSARTRTNKWKNAMVLISKHSKFAAEENRFVKKQKFLFC